MSTTYVLKKCKKFGFANDMNEILKNVENPILLESLEDEYLSKIIETINETSTNKPLINASKETIDETSTNAFKNDELKDETINIVVDLESDIFNDIDIVVPKDSKNETNKEHIKDDKELRNLASGNSTQLEAFSTNHFVVIYGKKSASIPQVCSKQKHEVIDYLAMNGVICSPNLNKVISFQKLVDFLKRFNSFSIYAIHSELDNTKFIEFETPTHNSYPAYNITKGEIIAIFYRYIIKNFFAYCEVIDEATNRELDYEF